MRKHFKNDTQTLKDHSPLIDKKMIRNYLSNTVTQKQETPTQK